MHVLKPMLKVLLILSMGTTVLFAQNTTSEESTPSTPKEKSKKYTYNPHTIGISTRIGGAGLYNVAENNHVGLNTTTIDFYPGKRIGKTKYVSLIQFRFSIPFCSIPSSFPFFNEFRWGILLGGSQYLFDYRIENGLGWSMIVNGGLLFDLPTIDRLKNSPNHSALNLGTELDFKVIYNIEKYTAITFGFNVGYTISYTYRPDITLDQEGFPLPIPQGVYLEHAFVWGFNIGVLF